MNYIKLMNLVREFGYSNFVSSSSELLKVFLNNRSYEFYSAFNIEAWTLDNLLLLLEQSSLEKDVSFLKKYNYQKCDLKTISVVVLELIRKNYCDLLVDIFSVYIKENRELLNLFLENISTMNISVNKLVSFLQNNKYRYEILSRLVGENRFDLLSLLWSYSLDFDSREIKLYTDNAAHIVEYLNFFNVNIPNQVFKTNIELLENLFLNGYSKALYCIKYLGYDDVIKYVNSNSMILNKFVEFAKTEDVEFLFLFSRIPALRKRKDLLKIMLERKLYDKLSFFDVSAWTVENQILYYKLRGEIDEKTLKNNSYYLDTKLPFLVYKLDYMFNKPYITKTSYSDINAIESFCNFNVSVNIGECIAKGMIENNSYLTRFYKFMFDIKSQNVHRLIIALVQKDIANLDRIFDEDGFTDYFNNFILFDYDYIFYKGESILEEYNSLEYATFVRILNINEKFKKYLYCLDVDADNLSEYFNNKSITRKAIDKLLCDKNGILGLIELASLKYELDVSDLERSIISRYTEITSQKQRDFFLDYCLSHKDILKREDIDKVFGLINKVVNSNSYEIRKQADNIVSKLINKDDCIERFIELESIFIDGASPEFIKRFAIYKVLYGDVDITKDFGIKSPILKSLTREEADKLILDDLLRVSLATNSLNIQRYLQILIDGFKVYCRVDPNDKQISSNVLYFLHEYRIRLEFIAKYFLKLDYKSFEDDYQTIFSIERECLARNGLKDVADNFHWPMFNDLILRDISCSFGSIMDLQSYMARHRILKIVWEESRHLCDKKLSIKKGDFLKGINSDFLDNIFSFGVLSKEFLGEDATQDSTHLDTDMSLIDSDVDSIPDLLKMGLTACSWGDMKLLISRDYIDQIGESVVTIDKDGEKTFGDDDKNKTEIFCYNSSTNHYCIRTGFPKTYVKAIIASRNFDRARFIVLKSGFFVPIYDTNGKLVFSFEDYCKEREALEGLTYYGFDDYTISDNIYSDEIVSMSSELKDSKEDAMVKRNAIYSKIMPVFNKYFSGVRDYICSSVNKGIAEIVDTGSTGRGTNVIGDGDFDFIVRLDQEFLESSQFDDFSSEIYKLFGKSVGDKKIIRLNDVKMDGIEENLQIEITFINKNSKVEYSTDMCIKDRLSTIEKLYPDKYPLVIANILFAKKFFKALGIYKRFEGGIGGIGVENFVLQHNGSFYDAVSHFVNVADSCEMRFDEFKKKFHIYDFGKNHYAYASVNRKVDFPYDNFVNNITSSSFLKLVSALKAYLGYEKENKNMQH